MDRVLFAMPEDPELFMAALATVQDYGWSLSRRDSRGEWVLSIHSPNPQMDFLKPCFLQVGDEHIDPDGRKIVCPVSTTFVDEWNPRRGEWDYVFKFDGEAAYEFSVDTQQTAATMFGIQIGAAPFTGFPKLLRLQENQPSMDVVVMDFEGQQELFDLIELNFPEFQVSLYSSSEPGGEYEIVTSYEMVVGPRSLETYIAASAGRRVVELYPDDRHPKWLAKWAGNYQMVYGSWFPVGMVWRAVEEVLERWPITARR